jgi:Ca2+-transporting ATPase
MKFYALPAEKALDALMSRPDGLTSEEAAVRLGKNGRNKLSEIPKTPVWKRFLQQMADPMIIILLCAAIISAVTSAAGGGDGLSDVIIILTVVVVNAVLGVVQESKAEQAIEALKKMTAATTKVFRDGKQSVIESEKLVAGDVIVLEAGDAVPADARLLESASMKCEESAMTGESVPAEKSPAEIPEEKDVPLGDRTNMVYMGCSVVYGRGTAVVTATGMDTEMGKIAGALSTANKEKTPLQLKLAQLSKVLTWAVLGICAVVFAAGVLKAGDLHMGVILDTFIIAVSLAVAAIPEGLAAVVTIVLSIGVTRMSKQGAVIRKLSAVETLGCTQVICSDKTGTLTQNKMTVVETSAENKSKLAESLALCSDAELGENGKTIGDPTQCAVVDYASRLGMPKNRLLEVYPRVGEIPFDSKRKLMTTVHARPEGGCIQHTTGAPDVVLFRCTSYAEAGRILPMTEEKRTYFLSENTRLASKALRVLAAGCREYDGAPASYSPDTMEQGLTFLGLAGMIDPIRPEAFEAVQKCRKAGIRAVMITGDHRDTAAAIGKQLGILSDASQAITGADVEAMTDEELFAAVERYSVYARVQPEHKTRIVNAWKKRGMVTAMTGDGVNDAPSIKAADIGVGMGITGTDVTKNVADMILSDDNFSTIVKAVEEGRRIYDNIRRAIRFLLSSNMAEVLAVFTATMIGFTVLRPTHLLWINLITDCFPAIALGLEGPEKDIMACRPRRKEEGIFAGGMGLDIAYQGVLIAVLTLVAYYIGHYVEARSWIGFESSRDGMTMAFLTMSMAEIFHSYNGRSERGSIFTLTSHNVYLSGAMIFSLVMTAAVIYVPFLSTAFGFASISFGEYCTAMGLAFLVIPVVEIVKVFQRPATGRTHE